MTIKATFFILGSVAKDMPFLIYNISKYGHEIGSHSYDHKQLFALKDNEIKEQLYDSKSLLEDLISQEVYGFRAPFFSINKHTSYIFDLIKEVGYTYDSSVFPISGHDLYGIPDTNSSIHIMDNGLIEMPMSTIKVLGKKIPVLGGGYYRLYPYLINEYAIKSLNNNKMPAILYLHPHEIGGIYSEVENISFLKYIRYYYNCGEVIRRRLKKMLKKHSFTTHIDYLRRNGMLNYVTPQE